MSNYINIWLGGLHRATIYGNISLMYKVQETAFNSTEGLRSFSWGYNSGTITKTRHHSLSTHPLADLSPFFGNFSFAHSVFAISTLDVFALHIIGNVQNLCASYIYILYLPAPPPFSYRISFLRTPFFSVCLLHPYVLSIWRALRGIGLTLTPLPGAATKIGAIDL
jgi:hypothetical protein